MDYLDRWALQQWDLEHNPFLQAQKRAEIDVVYRQHAELTRLQHLTSNTVLTQALKEARQKRDEKALDEIGFYFITISPRDTVSFPDFKQAVERFVKRKWVSSYVYVYEQRGIHENEIGKGFHMHMILTKPDKNFARILKETKNTFKHLFDDTCSSAIDIDGRFKRDLNNTISYILAEKQDPGKRLKQEIDKLFRKKYNLQDYYIKNFSLPIVALDANEV